MKKIITIFNIFILGALLLASCELNEVPKFKDTDSFVGFTAATLSVSEKAGVVRLPVTFASIDGKTVTATYTLIEGTSDPKVPKAKQGINFALKNPAATITFDAQTRNTFIEINILDQPNKFTGDLKFTVQISAAPGANVGGDNICVVTINDQDHPLTDILGVYNASGTSYFNGATGWPITFAKDASDITKVWISNFVEGGSSLPVYGIVNKTMTEIKVPVGQRIDQHTTYKFIELVGFYGPDGAVDIEEGGNITIKINPDFSMDIMDEIGSYVWRNEDKTSGAGYFNVFAADIKLKR